MRGNIRIPTQLWKANFNYVFVNVWCAVLDDQLIGPFILEGRLTGEAYLRFLQKELPRLLEDMPFNKRGRNDGAPPHSSREVGNFLIYRFPGQWIRTWRSPQLAIQVSRFQPTGLLCMGMDERTGLQCEVGNASCIAWSHFRCSRPHQKQSGMLQRASVAVHNQAAGRVAAGGGIFENQL